MTFHDRKASPTDIMERFAREAFEEPRRPDLDSGTGHWVGPNFFGTFKLIDGMRDYRLIGYPSGEWEVTPL